jgi:hypothetical protein
MGPYIAASVRYPGASVRALNGETRGYRLVSKLVYERTKARMDCNYASTNNINQKGARDCTHSSYSTTTNSVPDRPNVSGAYISSAFVGGTMNSPGVVARITYE